jgi:Tfp pilus assembly protein PilE
MVVVAMVGVLAAIAIPNYTHFTAKARTAEAKIGLAAAFTAEQAFFAENGSFTYCLRQAGYVPEGANRYYLMGFSNDQHTNTLCGPSGNNDCRRYNYANSGDCSGNLAGCCNALNLNGSDTTPGWPAPLSSSDMMYHSTVTADSSYKPFYDLFVGPSFGGTGLDTQVTQNTFVIGAAGCIFPINAPNYWTSPVPRAMRSAAHAAAAFDGWTIDQNKALSNPYPGF